MTDQDEPYRPLTPATRPGEGGIVRDPQLESATSAANDDLAQTIGVQGVADGDDFADSELPTADSLPLRPARQSLIKASDRVPSADDADADAAHNDASEQVKPAAPEGTPVRGRRRKPKGKKAPWWELPALIAVAIIVAVLIKTFLIQPFYIPSESMERTLHGCTGCSGDRVLVNKPILHIRDPHPGDIIVFPAPPTWELETAPVTPSNPIVRVVRDFGQLVGVVPPDQKDLIKRVIAIGGQTVQCCDSAGNVQVADSPTGPFRSLHEPYIYRDTSDGWTNADKPNGQSDQSKNDFRTFGPVTVPKGRLWVMGDHRNDSADSAYHWRNGTTDATLDTVEAKTVIGKAVLIAWPPSRWRTLGTPATFKAASALGAGAPLIGSALAVLPIWGVRRRRRR